MQNNRQDFPEEFIIKVVLDSLDIENEDGFVKLAEDYKKYGITVVDIKKWRENYLDHAAAIIQRLKLDSNLANSKLNKVDSLTKAFIEKAPALFTDQNDYCKSFYESSYVTDDIKTKNDENIVIDYEGLNYVRYMKLFSPPIQREFPKFDCFKAPLPYDKVQLESYINDPYHLRYYLPKNLITHKDNRLFGTHKDNKLFRKKNRIVIMLNGLNEDSRFDVYDILGEFFANNGMAAVLLPTPFNLNRRLEDTFKIVKNGKTLRTVPTDWAQQCPLLFYYSFLKTYDELNELVNKINPPDKDFHTKWKNLDGIDEKTRIVKALDIAFYKKHFWKDEEDPNHTEIILLGYSLGGLKALSYFINSPFKYRCCITVNSGPNLLKANSKIIDANLNPKDWISMLENARDTIANYENVQEWEKSSGIIQDLGRKNLNHKNIEKSAIELRNIFLTTYFDKPVRKVKNKIKDEKNHIISRYLAINSGSDRIVRINQMKQIAPRNKHIHQLIVAGVDHNPVIDQNWNEVLPQVEDDIFRFINSCIHEHYKRQDIADEMYDILKVLDSYEKDKIKFIDFGLDFRKNFSNDDLIKLIIKIETAEKDGMYNSIIDKSIEKTSSNKLKNKKLDINATKPSKVEKFLELYYTSKSFFINFSELYNKTLRDAYKREKNKKQ